MKGWLFAAGILSLHLSSAQVVWFPRDQSIQLDSSFVANSHHWRIKARKAISHIKSSSFGPYKVEDIKKGKATFVEAHKEHDLLWNTRVTEFLREGYITVSNGSAQVFSIAYKQKEVKKKKDRSLLGNILTQSDNDEEHSSYTVTYPAFVNPSDSSFWVSSFGSVGTIFSIELEPYYFTNTIDTIRLEVQLRRDRSNAVFPEIKSSDIAGIVLSRLGQTIGALELRREKFAPNDYAWVSNRLKAHDQLMIASLIAFLYGCLDTSSETRPEIR